MLASPSARIDVAHLQQFDSLRGVALPKSSEANAADGCSPDAPEVAGALAETAETPDERIDEVAEALSAQLRDELSRLILTHTPDAFEQLIVDLMIRHDVGVRLKRAVLIQAIDLNDFEND